MPSSFTDVEGGEGRSFGRVAFSRDGAFLVSWGQSATFHSSLNEVTTTERVFAEIRHPHTGRLVRSFQMDQGVASEFALSANGLWLAVGDERDDLQLWDIASGICLGKWSGHRGGISAVHFAGPGRILTSSADCTALLWELRPKDKPSKPLWDALAGSDALEAYRAVWAIADDPKGPELLRSKIATVRSVPIERVNQLLADLGADKYAVREAATKNLLHLGRLMEPDLRATFERTTSEEVRRRSESLLAKIVPERSPQEYLHARAVAAMEIANTADARKLLAEWATGAAGARLTLDAKAALARLSAR